jgi:hypothetical protein
VPNFLANAARQLAIKNDPAELLPMANELQAYVGKTNENCCHWRS